MKVFILLAAVVATTLAALEFRPEDLTVSVENGPSANIFEIIGKLIEIGKLNIYFIKCHKV